MDVVYQQKDELILKDENKDEINLVIFPSANTQPMDTLAEFRTLWMPYGSWNVHTDCL